jgi:hypothetical protein
MTEEEDRRTTVDRKDMEIFRLEIVNLLQKLSTDMVKKEDIEEIVNKSVNSHAIDCPLKHKDFLIKDQSYDEWCKCKKAYEEENMKSFNNRYEYWKKIATLVVAAGGGGAVIKIIETLGK